MKLLEILSLYTNEKLKPLVNFCNCRGITRKDDLIGCIYKTMTTPESLRAMWRQLDDLSQKAVMAAYYNEGELNTTAFVAQYGKMPERPKKKGWGWSYEPILLDLFLHDLNKRYGYYIYNDEDWELMLPSDLMPLLAGIVPPPDRFQVEGLAEAPKTTQDRRKQLLDLICIETEPIGLHDLAAYLRLVDQGKIKVSKTSGRITTAAIKQVLPNLLQEDFLSLPEKYRAADTIRPFGLDVFSQEAKLVANRAGQLQLTKTGRQFYQTRDPDILLDAFETWTEKGSFDELSRVSVIKGQGSRKTRLTKPNTRREAVIEALSWCPAGVWIDIEDFYRAIKIWNFDFKVENTQESGLRTDAGGTMYGKTRYWTVVKGSYINVVLWEYLGTLGALDLLYLKPEDAPVKAGESYYSYQSRYFSLYDGLKYFRVNSLGAYLLGQAGEYIPSKPADQSLFVISDDLTLTITRPAELTPNAQSHLEQMAIPIKNGQYQLNTPQLLAALEAGANIDYLVDFLQAQHKGSLPQPVLAWLKKIKHNSQAVKVDSEALLIKVKSADLTETLVTDPALKRFCYRVDDKTLVVPANKQKAFQTRLKELEYVLLA